jgi:hypothetical protein
MGRKTTNEAKTSSAALPRIVPGFNHHIPYQGVVYHVQTEYLQLPKPHIGTQVYRDGQIIEAERTYVLNPRYESPAELNGAMIAQHRKLIRRLIAGQLGGDGDTSAAGSQAPTSYAIGARVPLWVQSPADRRLALARNLELRRSVALVARAVRVDEPPTHDQVRSRLGSIVASMSDIAIRHPYRQSRHDELAELLMLRSEAIAWIRDPAGGDQMGWRLFEGFVNVTHAFAGISRRSDLIEHDRETWTAAQRALGSLEDQQPVSDELLESLRTTWGRHQALDDLLDFGSGVKAGALKSMIAEAVATLQEELRAASLEEPGSDRRRRPEIA